MDNLSARAVRALRRLLPSLALVALPGTAATAGDLRIEVDLTARQLTAYDGENAVKTYAVAVGAPDDPTPTGTFTIRKLIWNPAWVPPKEPWAKGKQPKAPGAPDNPMQRVKIFFKEPDYYIHGTPDTASMGQARSHGCLRMTPSEVTDLARLVMEYGGTPKPLPWYQRIFRRRTSDVVVLSKPIPIHVRD